MPANQSLIDKGMNTTLIEKTNVRWSSQIAFIFATAGAAVGLGNIWRFPYLTGQNGGGAFILIYLACVIFLGVPLMMAEIILGRHGRQNPENTMLSCAREIRAAKAWKWVGTVTVASAFLILSYYLVIIAWVFHYFLFSLTGNLNNITSAAAQSEFDGLMNDFNYQLLLDSVLTLGTAGVIALGIHRGVEKVAYILFPSLIVLLGILFIYALNSGGFTQGMDFLFSFDLHKVTGQSVLNALGQAFFSLGISSAVLMMYGAYFRSNLSIAKTSLAISAIDTGIALFSGLVVFPIVFSQMLSPNAGPSLIFITLPVAFGQMTGGSFFATLFFLMLLFAAFTSGVGYLEPAVMWFKERFNISSRPIAALTMGLIVWFFSVLNISSFNILKHATIFGANVFDTLDFITAKITLPLGGLLIALFCGWVMPSRTLRKDLKLIPRWVFMTWLWSLRVIAPIAITIILVGAWI